MQQDYSFLNLKNITEAMISQTETTKLNKQDCRTTAFESCKYKHYFELISSKSKWSVVRHMQDTEGQYLKKAKITTALHY